MDLAGLLGFLTLVIAVPLLAYVTLRLIGESKGSTNPVLGERKRTAKVVFLNVLVFALIFYNNDLPIPFINPNDTKTITRSATLVMGIVASIYWLGLYPPDYRWLRALRARFQAE